MSIGEWEPGKKPPDLMSETEEENRGKMRTFYPHTEADESQRIMSLVKNLPTQLWEIEEENRRRESIDEKPPELNEEMWEENRKIIDIVDEKTFQPGLRTGKKKPRLMERRDLVGIRCCSVSESNCKRLNHQMQVSRRSIKETDLRLSTGFWL